MIRQTISQWTRGHSVPFKRKKMNEWDFCFRVRLVNNHFSKSILLYEV